MSDTEKLEKLLKGKTPLVCMLAPSFVADFDYPEIVFQLKELGFDKVVELTFGAKMTNIYCHKTIKNDKSKTWIASPCPTLVQLIRNKYPHLKENLVPAHSPMGCMALICEKFYPKHKYVFVGPCLTKKVEAKELPLVELAITFRELEEIFKEKGIDEVRERKLTFDKFYNDYTKIYPLAGGLASTLHYKRILKKKQILIEDGIDDITKILDKFKDGKYKHYVFFDCLACKGGCIGGPGMTTSRSVEEKKKRVIEYRDFARSSERDLGRRGKIVHVEEIDFTRKF
jgi:iron only hydrogenase large subunit-like protein